MAKVFYRDETFEIVTKDRLQELLGIKNVTRDQIFSYKYINDGEE